MRVQCHTSLRKRRPAMDIIHDLARALATQMAEEDYDAEQAREEKTSVLSANAPVRLAAANAAIAVVELDFRRQTRA